MPWPKHPPVVVQNYLQQSRAAEVARRQLFEDLKRDGWVYDGETRTWTHPLLPGQMIQE